MASNSFLLFILLLAIVGVSADFDLPREKKTFLRLYFHGITSGPNRTSASSASINGNTNAFGNIQTLDNFLRTGPQHDAPVIGRCQGIAIRSSMYDEAMSAVVNFIFTAGKYKGSTLTIVGYVNAAGYGDRTIVGGGGQFRMARGSAISANVDKYVDSSNLVVQFDFAIFHYDFPSNSVQSDDSFIRMFH